MANFARLLDRALRTREEEAWKDDFKQNLLVSEIFAEPVKGTSSRQAKDQETPEPQQPKGKADSLEKFSIAEFEQTIKAIDFGHMNTKKFFAFVEMLDRCHQHVSFNEEELVSAEGHLLRIIYSDVRSLNFFVFKKSFRAFLSSYSRQLDLDLKSRIRPQELFA